MENLYEFILTKSNARKISINEITFIEYICPIEVNMLPVWTPHDYVVHVLSGKKNWKTSSGELTLEKGDTAFISKGGHIVEQDFSEGFCALLFFIKNEFKSLLNLDASLFGVRETWPNDPINLFLLKNNPSIVGYFNSVYSYFQMDTPPAGPIAKLKFQELLYLLATETENHRALCMMISFDNNTFSNLEKIMTANYMYNFSLENYAELCNRSLSSFKRDFWKCFKTTPGKWLKEKRLHQARLLLNQTQMSVTQIAFECGFENLSHFSRTFKLKMNITPKEYREKFSLNLTAKSMDF